MSISRRTLLRATAFGGGALAFAGHNLTSRAAAAVPHLRPADANKAVGVAHAAIHRITSAGIPPQSAAQLPGGPQLLSVRFPAAIGANPVSPNVPAKRPTATLRYRTSAGTTQELHVHPTTHLPDHAQGAIASEPIALPADAVALEFLSVAGLASGAKQLEGGGIRRHGATTHQPLHRPTAHIHRVGAGAMVGEGGVGEEEKAVPGIQREAAEPNAGELVQLSSTVAAGSSELGKAVQEIIGKLPKPGNGPLLPGAIDANVAEGLRVISRAQWGADENLMGWTPTFAPARVITVHHAAMPTGVDYPANVRAIYRYHASSANGGQGWGDIGYHLLIDPNGAVYQGRSTGMPGQAVFSAGSLLGQPHVVDAGHVYNANRGNIGICLLGDFTRTAPTDAAVAALTRVVGALCRALNLDPRGSVNYQGRTRPSVSGHRDWADVAGWTSCPGEQAYPLLPQVRANA